MDDWKNGADYELVLKNILADAGINNIIIITHDDTERVLINVIKSQYNESLATSLNTLLVDKYFRTYLADSSKTYGPKAYSIFGRFNQVDTLLYNDFTKFNNIIRDTYAVNKNIIMLRHANRETDVLTSDIDPELSVFGRLRADQYGKILCENFVKGRKVKIYTSPFARSIQTATLIKQNLMSGGFMCDISIVPQIGETPIFTGYDKFTSLDDVKKFLENNNPNNIKIRGDFNEGMDDWTQSKLNNRDVPKGFIATLLSETMAYYILFISHADVNRKIVSIFYEYNGERAPGFISAGQSAKDLDTYVANKNGVSGPEGEDPAYDTTLDNFDVFFKQTLI